MPNIEHDLKSGLGYVNSFTKRTSDPNYEVQVNYADGKHYTYKDIPPEIFHKLPKSLSESYPNMFVEADGITKEPAYHLHEILSDPESKVLMYMKTDSGRYNLTVKIHRYEDPHLFRNVTEEEMRDHVDWFVDSDVNQIVRAPLRENT